MAYDLVINGGLFFDGTGAPPAMRHVGVRDGRVVELSDRPLSGGRRTLDAGGAWVTPGFIDLHTHYDAELIAAPALSESVRHGVTSVVVGSCSISAVLSSAEDCSDLFTRVESVPREFVLPLLAERKRWSTPGGYVDFLAGHPLGANVASFLGHSDLRARVMGLGRAVDSRERPREAELAEMERWLEEALDAGMLGLSTMTNPWDKLDGQRFRSKQLPSTYATWGEYRRLNRVLRRRGRVLQSAPNLVTPLNVFLFMLESLGGLGRSPLKTTLITLADAKANPRMHRLVSALSRLVNGVLGGDLRWQTLPMPFEVYADGMDLVVFEEFGAGRELLHLVELAQRRELLADPAYRQRFRRDYERRFSPRVWQRDFGDAFVVECPDQALVGQSFGAIAAARGVHPVDAFLDLVLTHGTALRWRTTIANHRPQEIERMVQDPSALLGFADSGAHIRNMAFYAFPLAFLGLVEKAAREGRPLMSRERAVQRLTGELAGWLGLDAGRLALGDRADLAVLDPRALDERLYAYHEAPMPELGGLRRMVNRSEGAVPYVVINGRVAAVNGQPEPELGRAPGFGRFLPAGRPAGAGQGQAAAAA